VIPLRDTQEISVFPVATLIIIAINILIFLGMLFLSATANNSELVLNNFYLRYGLIPYQLTTGNYIVPSLRPAWLTIFTSIFLHGGFVHIIGNLWYFWIFGNNVEDYLGTKGFVIFYLLGGAVASLTQVAMNPISKVPIIGASGAIAAIMGAYFYLFPRSRVKTLVFIFFFITFIEVPASLFLIVWFLMQLSSAFTTFGAAAGVAFWAHVGGFVFGFLAAMIIKKTKRGKAENYYGF